MTPLSPRPRGAVARWRWQVEAHHAQSLRAMGDARPEDFWRPYARHFTADPHRTDDPVVNRLVQLVDPSSTVLDVGGGAGRLALPLALRCREVTVVEPSPSMVEALWETARQAGIANVRVVQATWEEAEVAPADLVLCSHVLYGVADVVPFVRKMEAHARRWVAVLLFMESPQAHTAPFWRAVHGERRVNLPGLREFLPLLWELDIYPNLEMFPPFVHPVYESREQALEELRGRLYVRPGAPEEGRLARALGRLLVPVEGGLAVRGVGPRRQGLLLWAPATG